MSEKPQSACTSQKINTVERLLIEHNIDVSKAIIHISNTRLLDFIDDLLRRTREKAE